MHRAYQLPIKFCKVKLTPQSRGAAIPFLANTEEMLLAFACENRKRREVADTCKDHIQSTPRRSTGFRRCQFPFLLGTDDRARNPPHPHTGNSI